MAHMSDNSDDNYNDRHKNQFQLATAIAGLKIEHEEWMRLDRLMSDALLEAFINGCHSARERAAREKSAQSA